MKNLGTYFSVLLASTKVRLIVISRYPGQLVGDIIFPIFFAAMPILLGRALGGEHINQIFKNNTGTDQFAAYMLIGSSTQTIVSFAFWHVAWWLRWEQQTGTLETLYMVPTHRVWVVAGTALYSCLRSLFTATLSFLLGCLILGVDPFQGEVGLAYLFILVGQIPLYGLTLLFGALILKIKEANSLVGLMQWAVSFLMGVYYPIAIFPPLLKTIALLFPPTWMTNGVRSSLLGIGYFLGEWYLDFAVLWAALLVAPMFGYWVFTAVEKSVRSNEGVGQF
jgi:ABC-2 type transport system permease protein